MAGGEIVSALRHVIGVSGGKDSVALALRLKEVEPKTDWEYLITPNRRRTSADA